MPPADCQIVCSKSKSFHLGLYFTIYACLCLKLKNLKITLIKPTFQQTNWLNQCLRSHWDLFRQQYLDSADLRQPLPPVKSVHVTEASHTRHNQMKRLSSLATAHPCSLDVLPLQNESCFTDLDFTARTRGS